MRWSRIFLFAAAAAVALPAIAGSQEADRDAKKAPAEKPTDRLDAALQQRIAGKASAEDVRIEANWRRKTGIVSSRVYGNGVGIWRDQTQFSLTHAQVLELLRALRDARFGAMAKVYGGEEGEEEEAGKEKPKEKTFLRGSVILRIGTDVKRVAQLMDGDQHAPLARLADRILGVSEKAAKTGVGAASLSDGLSKLADGKLKPETLQILAQSRADRPGESQPGGSWILRIDGRRVFDRIAGENDKDASQRVLVLSDEDFRKLAEILRDSEPQGLPRNLFSTQYVHLDIRLLAGHADLTARRYAGKTAETLGARQVAFDRIYAALQALHERVEKEGAAVALAAE